MQVNIISGEGNFRRKVILKPIIIEQLKMRRDYL